MDQYRKEFEYEEEKGVGGFLLIFFIMMLSSEPILGIIATAKGYQFFISNPVLKTGYILAGILIIAALLVECTLLKKISKLAVPFVKIYLAARIVFYIPTFIINTIIQIENIPYLKTERLYNNEYYSIILSNIIYLFYVIAFSVLWWLYFNKSKRVKLYYGS